MNRYFQFLTLLDCLTIYKEGLKTPSRILTILKEKSNFVFIYSYRALDSLDEEIKSLTTADKEESQSATQNNEEALTSTPSS